MINQPDPYVVYEGTPVYDDRPSPESQLAIAVTETARAVDTFGADAAMHELFILYPEMYGKLCMHFYKDFYKPLMAGAEVPRVAS